MSTSPRSVPDSLSFFLGIVVSVVTIVPLILFGLALFANNITIVLAMMLATLFVLALVFGTIHLARHRLFGWLGTRLATGLQDVIQPYLTAIDAARNRQLDDAASFAREGIESTVTWVVWAQTRAFVLKTMLSVLVAFGALIGSALLYKQNETLASQSEILDTQTSAIISQTEAMKEQNAQLASQIEEIKRQADRDRQQQIANDAREDINALRHASRRFRRAIREQYAFEVGNEIARTFVSMLGPDCTPSQFAESLNDPDLLQFACAIGHSRSSEAKSIVGEHANLANAAINLRGGLALLSELADLMELSIEHAFDVSLVANSLSEPEFLELIRDDVVEGGDLSIAMMQFNLARALAATFTATSVGSIVEIDSIANYLDNIAHQIRGLNDDELIRLSLLPTLRRDTPTHTGDVRSQIEQIKEANIVDPGTLELIEEHLAMLELVLDGDFKEIGRTVLSALAPLNVQSPAIDSLKVLCSMTAPTGILELRSYNHAIFVQLDSIMIEQPALVERHVPSLLPMRNVRYDPFVDLATASGD